jgi:PIN domain nuclease of toxin-antitoxin system
MPAVLDASAVLAIYFNEPGREIVSPIVFGSLISAVNYSEVLSKAADRGDDPDLARGAMAGLGLIVVPFDQELAVRAAALRATTRRFGLSVGDRACLALALREQVPALTTDRAWSKLSVGVEVVLIR